MKKKTRQTLSKDATVLELAEKCDAELDILSIAFDLQARINAKQKTLIALLLSGRGL
jgi:hypothetical protein